VSETNEGSVAAKGAVFIGFAKLYFMLSGFVQQVLLTRFVGAAEFGAFGVVNNVISIRDTARKLSFNQNMAIYG